MTTPIYKLFINVSFLCILAFFITLHLSPSPSFTLTTPHRTHLPQGCRNINTRTNPTTICAYIRSHKPCSPRGYIDYLEVFYCVFGDSPLLGYTVLILWLIVLFYLLGNTASVYFCSNLEGLSTVLGLPPTIAGVTLLALGNGAPDVFASFVSFKGGGTGAVGISSVLGGAFFVTTMVVGVISIFGGGGCIDRASFFRDSGFLIAVLCSLLLMLVEGKVSMIGAVCFTSLYIVYVVIISVGHCCRPEKNIELQQPLLDGVTIDVPATITEGPKPSIISIWVNWIMYLIELPLYLPRRITIPDVNEERWSKPFAVASITFSPVLLAALSGGEHRLSLCLFGLLVGLILGIIGIVTIESSRPPEGKWRLPWLSVGFSMSVVWTYLTAGELVALLVAAGHILDISPGILGLTVLAWGNSLGDLIANVAMALNGSENGVQIAITGCYAGPIFNTLIGLGLSMVLSTWKQYPTPLLIDHDESIYETVVFLIAGLVWAIIVLPRREMKIDRVLGIGLLVIYLCFLILRFSELAGIL